MKWSKYDTYYCPDLKIQRSLIRGVKYGPSISVKKPENPRVKWVF